MIVLTIPGEPVAKGRPRAFKRGNFIKMHTPEKTKNYETLIQELFAVKYPDFVPLEGPVSMALKMFMAIPSSASKKKRAAMLSGEIRPTKKPDIDNVIKIVGDALNELAFKDDKQIVELTDCEKWYGEQPKLVLKIQGVG